MKQWLERYKHAWILLYAFLYIPWFSYLERTVTRDYYVIHTRLDDFIPFHEFFIIPYLAWFFYVSGVILYFFFKNKQDYYRLCIYLFTGMTLSLIVCTVFHNGTDLRPVVDPEKNICSKLVACLHAADTSTNIFPSIHAYNSIVVHLSIIKSEAFKNRRFFRLLSLIMAVSICVSTVCLKQHSIVDVMGAMLMAYAFYPMVYGNSFVIGQRMRESRLFTRRRSA
jgi:membrane-associated phospholipid phosphatase